VTGINDAPVVSHAGNVVSYAEQAAAVAVDNAITVIDADNATLANATATISSGYLNGDTLTINGVTNGDIVNGTHTIHYHYDDTMHAIALSGDDTVADYQAALQLVSFSNSTNDDPTAGGADTARTVTWAVHDGQAFSSTASSTVIVTDANDAPVISIDQVRFTDNGGGSATISELSVTDVDATSTETFTMLATTAGAGSGSTVLPGSGSDVLANVTATLNAGFTYQPGSAPTDMVTLTVADGSGTTDTVNFIFNVTETPAQLVTLTGTTAKDVFFGTGYQDKFVFAANFNHDTVMNFTPGQDHIDLSAIVSTGTPDWFSQHVTAGANSADRLVTIDAADTIVLHNVANLSANDFILHAP
jgi:hypothetical protein